MVAGVFHATSEFVFRSAGLERIWQFKSQKGTEHLNEIDMLAPTAVRRKVRGAKYREASDPETEIWRGCQRSGTAGGWG